MDKALQQENPLAALETLVSIATIGLNEGARRSGLKKCYSEDEVWDMLDERICLVMVMGEILAEAIQPQVENLGSVAMSQSPSRQQASNRSANKTPAHVLNERAQRYDIRRRPLQVVLVTCALQALFPRPITKSSSHSNYLSWARLCFTTCKSCIN